MVNMQAKAERKLGLFLPKDAVVKLKLEMQMSEIAGDRQGFDDIVLQDVARAVGGNPKKMRILWT